MARKLKEKLPRKFDRILGSGDLEAFRELYTERSPDARTRTGQSALHLPEVPEELKIWLLDLGADPDAADDEGNTPLHTNISSPDLFLERGADIHALNHRGENIAYAAVFAPDTLAKLIAAGADPYLRAVDGSTALMHMLRSVDSTQVSDLAAVARLLPDTPFTEEERREAQSHIIRLGETFEDYEPAYTEDYADLHWLYDTFDIPGEFRVTAPQRHDGTSPIHLPGGTWQEQFIAAWDLLVPAIGPARSSQGEAIRIAGRISSEFHDHGGANWDRDHKRMLRALREITAGGTPLSPADSEVLGDATRSIRKGTPTEEEIDTLPRLATAWVVANPEPLPLGERDYGR